MVDVCEGGATKADMLRVSLQQYKEMYDITQREFAKVSSVSDSLLLNCHRLKEL
jgi:hypothetical protein